jgi:hypothetical protein
MLLKLRPGSPLSTVVECIWHHEGAAAVSLGTEFCARAVKNEPASKWRRVIANPPGFEPLARAWPPSPLWQRAWAERAAAPSPS